MEMLLTEIWTHVAGYLSLQDAARLTGVCKNTARLQIKRMYLEQIEDPLPHYARPYDEEALKSPEGLEWAIERWPEVRTLHIRLRYGHAADQALVGRMISNARSLKELEGLCIDCCYGGECPEDATATLQEAKLLTAILHQARRLQLLQVDSRDPNIGASLHGPTLSGVQHILLQTGYPCPAPGSFTGLAAVGSLKTLHIVIDGDMMHDALPLAQLSRLTAVCLENMMPLELTLPEGCTLSVTPTRWKVANDPVWLSVKQHIKQFIICDPNFGIHSRDDLPQNLLEAPLPERVKLRCLRIGNQWWDPANEERLLLGQTLAGVKWLELESNTGMQLSVSETTSWESLVLVARGSLDLHFVGNGPPYHRRPFPALDIRCRALIGCGGLELFRDVPSSMARLECAWSRLNRPYETAERQLCITSDVPHPGVPSRAHSPREWRCFCGACEACLSSLGLKHLFRHG